MKKRSKRSWKRWPSSASMKASIALAIDLSGGERRRVAIAGILALKPNILVLDEPTAGLDPRGAREMMTWFKGLHEKGTTVILVTHDMNIVLEYSDTVIVMEDGEVREITTPLELFNKENDRYSLETPLLYKFVKSLSDKGMNLDIAMIRDIDSLASAIAQAKRIGKWGLTLSRSR